MADPANHIFLPWVAPGVAATLPDGATERLATDQKATVSLTVGFLVNGTPVSKTARLHGPGDIAGIDPLQIIRVEPRPATPDFEPNYFPLIEFDRPDFPWLFSPLKADGQGRLRPWLCLVVVRKQPGVVLRPATTQPLPVLEIAAPARPGDELPDLAESHLWAHAQVTGAGRTELKTVLDSQPAKNMSRLLCPRRLLPSTAYLACVVPAFEVGRRAGLNAEPLAADDLRPAWGSGAQAPAQITLPVFHSWEFRTGVGGDFEELVRRLQPRELPREVGKRPMSIERPGFVMQPQPAAGAPGSVLGLEGALRVVGSSPDAWDDGMRVPFQTALRGLLNTPWQLATKAGASGDPVVGPPVYGCWHAGIHEVPQSGQAPSTWPPPFWLDDLNLDPRQRATAAMGTQVIQDQQESLMASAWEQLGDIEQINQRLRQAQLSRAVNTTYHARIFSRLPDESFFRIVAPAQSRVVIEERLAGAAPNTPPIRMLLRQRLATSFVPATAVSAPLRQLTRARGALNRPYIKANQAGPQAMIGLFNIATTLARATPIRPGTGRLDAVLDSQLVDTQIQTHVNTHVLEGVEFQFVQGTPVAPPERGAFTVDTVSQSVANDFAASPQSGFIWVLEPAPHWERPRVGFTDMLARFRLASLGGDAIARLTTADTPAGLRAAAQAHHAALQAFFTRPIAAELRRPLVMKDVRFATFTSLTPSVTVSQAARSTVSISSPPVQTGDDLEPVMDAPAFPQPMYEALRDLSADYLFPGLEHVPANTVQLLQTNAKFVESFLVGLNFEMGRELLWRGYPTDQRGTYFQQFWDTAAAGINRLDIVPIHTWGQRPLGVTAAGANGDALVLLVRGELLRRYPGTVIYAVKAVVKDGRRLLSTDAKDEAHPIFRGTLDPDVNFLGFDLKASDVMASEGYFFVFQQQPTEPRFGMDDDPFGEGESGKIPELKTWDDLNWAHVAGSREALAALSHVNVNALQLAPTTPDKGSWGRNSAHMAYITKQRLVRIAMHASEMLP